jgi:hypothetical protein
MRRPSKVMVVSILFSRNVKFRDRLFLLPLSWNWIAALCICPYDISV